MTASPTPDQPDSTFAARGRIVLDHAAVGVPDVTALYPLVVGDLGGWVTPEGDSAGYRGSNVHYANGMRLETLRPHRVEENDFLDRFLRASGPGPHHMTFRVPEIHAAIEKVEAAGFPILYQRTEDAGWREAFLHPKVACGTVVQLAEYPDRDGPKRRIDPVPHGPQSSFSWVELTTAEPDRALKLFELLGASARSVPDGTELTWPDTAGVRIRGTDDSSRPGKVTRYVFTGVGAEQAARLLGHDGDSGEVWSDLLGVTLAIHRA